MFFTIMYDEGCSGPSRVFDNPDAKREGHGGESFRGRACPGDGPRPPAFWSLFAMVRLSRAGSLCPVLAVVGNVNERQSRAATRVEGDPATRYNPDANAPGLQTNASEPTARSREFP